MEKRYAPHQDLNELLGGWREDGARDPKKDMGTSTHPAPGTQHEANGEGTITDGGAGS